MECLKGNGKRLNSKEFGDHRTEPRCASLVVMSSMSQIRHGRVSFALRLLQGTGCNSQGALVTFNVPCCYSFSSDGTANASLTGGHLTLSGPLCFREQRGLGKARRCLLMAFQLILILSQQLTLLSLGLIPADWPQICSNLPASTSLRGHKLPGLAPLRVLKALEQRGSRPRDHAGLGAQMAT